MSTSKQMDIKHYSLKPILVTNKSNNEKAELLKTAPTGEKTAGAKLSGVILRPTVRKDVRIKRMYSGSMRITNQVFEEAYERSNSTEFKALAKQVILQVRPLLRPPLLLHVLRN